MIIFFQDPDSERVIFRTEDSPVIPNVGEDVRLEMDWYKVVERTFYYKHLNTMDDNSCTVWVKPLKNLELKASKEQMKHITKILGDVYNRPVLDFEKETDLGYEDYDDRIYIDGDITFDKMEEIVNFLKTDTSNK